MGFLAAGPALKFSRNYACSAHYSVDWGREFDSLHLQIYLSLILSTNYILYTIDFLKDYAEIITSLAAILAVLIYFKQKRDRVSEAATVVLLEIRQAERRISALRESGFVNISDNQLIITNNNWKNHSHLFARKFDHDELDLINRFYSNCQAIDRYTVTLPLKLNQS